MIASAGLNGQVNGEASSAAERVAVDWPSAPPGMARSKELAPEDVAEAVLAVVLQRGQALASRIELRPSAGEALS